MHGHETMSGLGSCIATALQCIDALEWAKHGNEHDPAEVLLGAVQVARLESDGPTIGIFCGRCCDI
jgi:hypothetical protein